METATREIFMESTYFRSLLDKVCDVKLLQPEGFKNDDVKKEVDDNDDLLRDIHDFKILCL